MATISLSAAEHEALVLYGQAATPSGAPIVCWHCHKAGHVCFHCPARQSRDVYARPPTPPLPPSTAEDAAARSTMVVSAVSAGAASSSELSRPDAASAEALVAAACPVSDAIVDPGASSTVVGADWLRDYLAALDSSLRATAVATPAAVLFRFGDRRTTLADAYWDIPIALRGIVRRLGTHVIPGCLPLLLSRPSLRVAQAVLYLADESLWPKDLRVTVPLCVDAVGHLTVNLLPVPPRPMLAALTRSHARRVSFAPLVSAPRVPLASAAVSAAPQSSVPAVLSPSAVPPPCASPVSPAPFSPSVVSQAPSAVPPAGVYAEPGAGTPAAAVDRRDGAAARAAGGVAVPAEAAGVEGAAGRAAPGVGPADPGSALPARLHRREWRAFVQVGVHLPAVLTRLHRTYAQAGADRIIHVLKEAGCTDAAIDPAMRRVTETCSACRSARAGPPRAVVTVPRPSVLNDTVAMDLAKIAGFGTFLHLIDLGTRLSRCVVVADKEAPTIVRALLTAWLCVYGAPCRLLSDPGREFHDALLRVLAERFNIAVNVTVGQSAWSNGICERHNGVITHMVGCLAVDCPAASIQELLDHACFAKNNLAVHGCASPFQLTTGSQPRVPSALSDALPAMQAGHVSSEGNLARTIALLAASRAAISRAEASQSVRRALNRRVPGDPGRLYARGDVVRYWEQSQSSARRGMHGPATVVTQAGRVVRLQHGGAYKTRNATDVEPTNAADPAPSPATDTGLVGTALSALRHATGPPVPGAAGALLLPPAAPAAEAPSPAMFSPPSPLNVSRLAAASAVARVVDGVSAVGRGAPVPQDALTLGVKLVAASDAAPGVLLAAAPRTGEASSHRDESWGVLVAHAVFDDPTGAARQL
eukprot:TRINITY_DN6081_c0_g1_i2.p1 TRINITY_DN6081_c0_g1~~TRINITY_DN6081_c0_g1_i2.p1  ORF type:complete len:874 (-),score=94.27 TRINITY_DN6081_c0_g1_i2:1941-4562(-)